jgi:hypothetical protein
MLSRDMSLDATRLESTGAGRSDFHVARDSRRAVSLGAGLALLDRWGCAPPRADGVSSCGLQSAQFGNRRPSRPWTQRGSRNRGVRVIALARRVGWR